MKFLYSSLIAGFLNILLVPLILIVAKKNHWYDKPEARKIHTAAIPRLGGVGIFGSFLTALIITIIFSKTAWQGFLNYWPILLSLTIIHGLGLLDDFFSLRARLRLIVQLSAAIFVMLMGFKFNNLWLPGLGSVSLGWMSWPITLFWIVGVTNAVNMIDGLDGLSGGISIIGAFSLGIILLDRGQNFPALVAITIAGSLAGYLFYNFPPAKIFMGDSGSTFLGFALALLPLMDKSGISDSLWLWTAPTVLLIPIFDVFAAILRRTRARVPLMSPDKWHVHHKLLRMGLSTRSILAIVYAVCIAMGAIAVSVLFLSPLLYWLAVLASWIALAVLFLVLHYIKERALAKEIIEESGVSE